MYTILNILKAMLFIVIMWGPVVYCMYKLVQFAIDHLKTILTTPPHQQVLPTFMEKVIMGGAMGGGLVYGLFLNFHDLGYEFGGFIAKDHFPTFIILAYTGLGSYSYLRFARENSGPLMLAFIPFGIITGFFLYGTLWVHLMPHLFIFASFHFFSLAVPQLFIAGIVLLCFPAGLVYFIAAFVEVARYNHYLLEKYPFKNGFWRDLADLYRLSPKGYFALPVLWVCFLQSLQSLLILGGQKPFSYVKAFTSACRMTLFGDGTCPDAEMFDSGGGSDHYLCTIAAQGNPRLVKPLRRGVRNGRLIWVNRQLMVCNAFEEWLSLKAPVLQRWLRKRYDALEIPVNKLSRYKKLAALLYLATKPLEWFFLVTLYLFDSEPEARIQKQYLPEWSKPA